MGYKELRIVLAVLGVVLVALVVFSVFSKEVGATGWSTKWKAVGEPKYGVCEAVYACGSSEGVKNGSQKEICVLSGHKGQSECKLGSVRYTAVSEPCEVEVVACEEPEEPTVPEEPVKDDTERPKFTYTQGPDKGEGDAMCKLQWKTINGSNKVEIRYAEDGVFGNGYKTIMTNDDGSHWVNVVKGLFKVRGRDSKTEWSETRSLEC